MRRLLLAELPAAFLTTLFVLAAVGASPASAADHSIVGYGPGGSAQCGGSMYCWAPASSTASVGDTVTFSDGVGYHGLHKVSGPWPASCAEGSLASCALTQPGTYQFNCSVHGPVMSGSIVVHGSAPTPAPTSTPTPAPIHSTAPPPMHPAPTTPPAAAPLASTPAVAVAAPSPAAAVALAPSPSSIQSPSTAPSVAPTVAPRPVSSTDSGSPIPVALGLLGIAALAAGALYWYGNRQAT